MDQSLKDLIQVITWVVTAFGGLIAAFKAVSELRRSNEEKAEAIREQREQFRWRQAEMARTILDQTWSNDLAKSALLMLDWSGRKYKYEGKITEPITYKYMYHALRISDTIFTEDEQYVRDCFDQLFDNFELIEHYLNIGLINWKDIHGRLDYYVDLLARQKQIYEQFLTKYQYKLALGFLNRFPQWSTTQVNH